MFAPPFLVAVMLLPGWLSSNQQFLECRGVRLAESGCSGVVGMRVTVLQFGQPGLCTVEDARVGCTVPVREGDHCTISLFWPFESLSSPVFAWHTGEHKEHRSLSKGQVVATCRIAGWMISEIQGKLAVHRVYEPAVCRALREQALTQLELTRPAQDAINRDLRLLRGPGAPRQFGWLLGRHETALLLWADQIDEERVRHWIARDPTLRFFWAAQERLEEVTEQGLFALLSQLPLHASREKGSMRDTEKRACSCEKKREGLQGLISVPG